MKPEARQKLLMILMVVLLIGAIGYIAVDKYNDTMLRAQQQYALAGYNQGITGAITSLYQNTENCQVATLNLGNVTRQVADVECFRRAMQSQQEAQPGGAASGG